MQKTGKPTRFFIAPLTPGAEAVEIDHPAFYFGHFVNTYSPAPGKLVADINIEDDTFFDRYSLDVQRTKALRDAWPATAGHGYETTTRFEFDLLAKTVASAPLFGVPSATNIANEHDLFKLHPDDIGRPYCGYWAWQAYYKSASFASWAVVRVELCGAAPVVAAAWHRPHVYPGEASFVPKPNATDKTDGVVVFKALDGNTGASLLVVADARTLATIAQAVLPVRVPYTIHGNCFPRE